MIVVCEPICWNAEHVPVNTAFLEIISLAYPREKIVFCGETSHLSYVANSISSFLKKDIIWYKIAIPDRRASLRQRWKFDAMLAKFLFTHFGNVRYILLLNTTTILLFFLKVLFHLYSKVKKIQIVLHSNLNYLLSWQPRNPVRRFFTMKVALSIFQSKNIQYLLLEEPLKQYLSNVLPKIVRYCVVIDHPIPLSEGEKNLIDFTYPLKFAFLGLCSYKKGFDIFLELADFFSKKYSSLVKFYAIGRLSESDSPLFHNLIGFLTLKPSISRLTRAEYKRFLKEIHYVVLPHHKNHYILSPSGVLLDAIAYEKPIIASNIPIFQYLFSRYGNIGFLCSEKKEFFDALSILISSFTPDAYRQQVLNITKIKYDRNPYNLANKYRQLTSC